MANSAQRTAIQSSPEETTEPKAKKTRVTPTESKATELKPVVQKSLRKMSFEEFATCEGFSKIFKAGFKMYTGDVSFLSEDEWKKKLQEYKNRSI